MGNQQTLSIEEVVAALSEPIPDMSAVTLLPVDTGVPGLTAEYVKHDGKVKIHFFADGRFPDTFKSALIVMIRIQNANKANAFAEYVPEAKSWYFEFRPSPMVTSKVLVDLFMKKLASLVGTNEHR